MKLEIIEGILHGAYPENIVVDLEFAKRVVKERNEFIGDNCYPTLIESSGVKRITSEARQYFGTPESAVGISAAALVSNNSFNNFMANFFVSVNIIKSVVEVKAFRDKKKAIVWLKTFIDEN